MHKRYNIEKRKKLKKGYTGHERRKSIKLK